MANAQPPQAPTPTVAPTPSSDRTFGRHVADQLLSGETVTQLARDYGKHESFLAMINQPTHERPRRHFQPEQLKPAFKFSSL